MAEHGPIVGHGLGGNSGKPRRHKAGRRCTYPGCTTKISVYNPTERCFLHATARRPRLRGRPQEV